jgi:hypothetical protein
MAASSPRVMTFPPQTVSTKSDLLPTSFGWSNLNIRNSTKPSLALRSLPGHNMFSTTSRPSRRRVDALSREPFTIVTDKVPGRTRLATLHLSISDSTSRAGK